MPGGQSQEPEEVRHSAPGFQQIGSNNAPGVPDPRDVGRRVPNDHTGPDLVVHTDSGAERQDRLMKMEIVQGILKKLDGEDSISVRDKNQILIPVRRSLQQQ